MGDLKQANLRLHQILELVITLSLYTSMVCYCRVYMILGDQIIISIFVIEIGVLFY